MVIQVDTREHARKVVPILNHFDSAGVKYIESKLYVGDYIDIFNPLFIIDRKASIGELVMNVGKESERFERELDRAKGIGAKVTFLITQEKISGKVIQSIDDIMLWSPPKRMGTMNGMTAYRKIARLKNIYDIDFVFCTPKNAGPEIIRLLSEAEVIR